MGAPEAEAPPAEAPPADEGKKGKKAKKGKKDPNAPDPKNVTQKAPKEFGNFLSGKKPNGKSRKCTDCLCLIMLAGVWSSMGYMGWFAFNNANPLYLLNGVDWQGNICGLDEVVKDKPLWTLVSWTGMGKCTDACPSTTIWQNVDPFNPKDMDKLICKEGLPGLEWWKNFPFYRLYYGDCMYSFQSQNLLGYCVINDMKMLTSVFEKFFPFDDDSDDDTATTPKNMLKKAGESTSLITDIVGDLYSARWQILGFGFGASVLLSFLYSNAMAISIVTKTVVWGSIFSIFFLGIAIAGYAKYQAGVWEYEVPQLRGDGDIALMKTVSNGGFGFAVFWLCFILFMRDRLNLAIGLVIETARALSSMPLLIIFIPVFQVICYAGFTIPWLFFLVYMAAMGNITTSTGSFNAGAMTIDYAYKEFSYDKQQQDLAWFYLFGYFWTSEFIVALGQMFTAMALCCYYFTRDKKKIGNCTVCSAICLVCRYHLGTVAFGSCIVALVRLLRAYVDYLEKTAGKNKTELQKLIMRCLKCMMYCIERCIKYINFNAYIQTCIWGTTFCVSGFNAFWLIFRNIARIAAVTGVTGFLSFIGKVTVILGTGGSFYYTMNREWPHLVNSLVVPTVLVMFIATGVAIMFFEVFGMGTTVLLQCYIADEEMFKDDAEGCFATDSLKSYLVSKKKKKKKPKGGAPATYLEY